MVARHGRRTAASARGAAVDGSSLPRASRAGALLPFVASPGLIRSWPFPVAMEMSPRFSQDAVGFHFSLLELFVDPAPQLLQNGCRVPLMVCQTLFGRHGLGLRLITIHRGQGVP